MDKYAGWANYHTWNVALWISNDESLYNEARHYASAVMNRGQATYMGFIGDIIKELPETVRYITPDGVSWTDPTLDEDELDTFIRQLAD